MHIAIVIDSLDPPAGAERTTATVASGLIERGHEVTLFETRTQGETLGLPLEHMGAVRIPVCRSGRFDVRSLSPLFEFVRARKPDVLHAHMFGSNVWAGAVARRSPEVAFVAHEHGTSFEGAGGRVMQFVNRHWISPTADAVVVGTDAEAARMVDRARVPAAKVQVIPAPYVERPLDPAVDLRAELGIPADGVVIGTLAWLRPEKALSVLISAFAEVAEHEPAVHLAIAGDGPCRADLERLAVGLGLGERVHFLGVREDVGNVLGALDIGASSSDRESTSMFALECIAAGVPIVSTRVGGAAELLEQDVSGLLVDVRDSSAMAAALQRLAGEPELRSKLAAAARPALAPFDRDTIVERYIALYEDISAQPSS